MGNCCLGVGQSAATDNNTNKGSSTAAAAAAEEEEHQRGSNVSNYDKNKIGGGQPKNKNKRANNTPAKSATKRKTNTGGNNNSIGGGGRNSTIHSVILKEHKLDVYKKYTETEVLGHGSMGHVAKVKVKDGYDGGSAYVGSTTYGKGGGNNKTARDAEKAKAAFIKGGGLLLTSSLGTTTATMGHVAKVKVKDGYDGGSAYVGSTTYGKGGGNNKTARDAEKAKAAFIKGGGLLLTSSLGTTTATASGGGGGQGVSSGSIDETKESIDSTTNHSIVDTNDSGTDAATDAATDGGGGGGGGGSSVNSSSGDVSGSKNCAIDTCYALKSIILDRVSTTFIDELKNEINILKAMDHPNIVKLHEVFSHKKQIYMILELCDGGDLYTRLPYTEKDSAYVTGKLLSAIKYMHDHGIVHRDLKFENIMFENKSSTAEIKVIDFGLSKKFATNRLGIMREGVGTLYSMAPQVLQGVYNSQADMWSVGVITYMLLSSHRPFYNKKRKIMIDRIMRCDYTFKKDYWTPISDDAKDFINHLLVLDPKVRYDALKAQKHKWLHNQFKIEDRAPTESVTGRVADNLLMYKNNLSLKKLALNVIAHRSSTAEIIDLRKAFDQFDSGNDGVISSEEFRVAITDKCSYSDDEVTEMFNSIDINQNGQIMYTEFIAATLEAQGQLDEDRIAEAFDRLDTDDTGFISKENIKDFLSDTDATMENIEHMIQGANKDHCGQVSFDEFLAMFRSDNVNKNSTNSFLLSSLKQFSDSDPRNIAGDGGSTDDVDISDDLVGIDAVIPGGKYDTEREQEEEEEA